MTVTVDEAIKIFNTVLILGKCDCTKEEADECFKMAIEALEDRRHETVTEFADRCRECGAKYGKMLNQYKAFTEWVASEIFSENWEDNKDAFVEIACRKLEKLGIVRVKGDEWELVESQESEVKDDT